MNSTASTSELHWTKRLFQPIDIGMLVYLRIAFGAVMVWEAYRYLSYNWFFTQFQNSGFYFKYFGFSWIHAWSGDGMRIHFIIWGILAAMIALGLCYRIATILFFFVFTYVFLLDQTTYLNHFYLISTLSFLMIFLPMHRAGSLDVLLRPQLRTTRVPAWTLWLLRFQIAVPYFFGGVAKINPDWLRGEPIRYWLAEHFGGPVSEPVVYAFAWGGMLFDLLIVPALLWKPTRIPAFVAAIAFHLTNDTLFHIGVFPWLMMAASVVFLPSDWLAISDETEQSQKSTWPIPSPSRQRWILASLAVWVGVQCLVPLRHWLYPGNVSWTEEGHRFAWHMKLRDKSADSLTLKVPTESGLLLEWELAPQWNPELGYPEFQLVMTATDVTGETVTDPPNVDVDVTSHQLRSAATKPDMLLQLAGYLADRVRDAGEEPTGVFADSMVSLNGRIPQPLVDPNFNLLKAPRNLWHAEWIRPLTVPLPSPKRR
ncbi:HTTM domain-containing protein [Thalassoroseus pseudoceratinae]|uniref:HTTM domain-containing protein n=1 Tax=Thalassoroseus pseudoceratinae TaxID=2713176 RepID=UPI00142444FF|nr:HTTM domain-containing protein [Thalassoroseus pseudoceratinae]